MHFTSLSFTGNVFYELNRCCETLCANGLPAAEITFRTAAAEELIREAAKRFPEMTIGAGTVLNCEDLHRAVAAGAKFAVAPGFNPAVAAEARKLGFDFIPGVCTPSEMEQAMALGFRTLKFFPAEAAGGVAMLKALIAPYRHLGCQYIFLWLAFKLCEKGFSQFKFIIF